jgi:hypothetical protein
MRHADKHRGGCRNEGLHLSQRYLEGLYLLAPLFERLNREGLRSLQIAGGEQSDVCCEMREFRMEFLAEPFYEFPNLVMNICYQGVTLLRPHDQLRIINTP